MYLSTHYCRDEQANAEVNGYSGLLYAEYGLDEPLSGLSEQSFWPTRTSLLAMLRKAGFGKCHVTFDYVDFSTLARRYAAGTGYATSRPGTAARRHAGTADDPAAGR